MALGEAERLLGIALGLQLAHGVASELDALLQLLGVLHLDRLQGTAFAATDTVAVLVGDGTDRLGRLGLDRQQLIEAFDITVQVLDLFADAVELFLLGGVHRALLGHRLLDDGAELIFQLAAGCAEGFQLFCEGHVSFLVAQPFGPGSTPSSACK